MIFFFSVRVDHSGVSFDELWDEWEKEVDAAQAALEAGKIKNLYKVSGRRRVVGVLDVDSHEGARPYRDGRAPNGSHAELRDRPDQGVLGFRRRCAQAVAAIGHR
jgi:muconolactone D-isomerase